MNYNQTFFNNSTIMIIDTIVENDIDYNMVNSTAFYLILILLLL